MTALTHHQNAERTVIYFQGAMTHKEIKNFKKLPKLPKSDINLNFKYVTKFDSAGIGFLVKLYKNALKNDQKIFLSEIPVKIRVLLEITQIDQLFPIIEKDNNQITLAA